MHAVETEVHADQHEPVDELGPAKRDEHRHDAAIAPPHEVHRRCDVEPLEHRDGVRGHVVVVERLVGVGRVPVPATIERDDPEAIDELPRRSSRAGRRCCRGPRAAARRCARRCRASRSTCSTPSISMRAMTLPPRSVDSRPDCDRVLNRAADARDTATDAATRPASQPPCGPWRSCITCRNQSEPSTNRARLETRREDDPDDRRTRHHDAGPEVHRRARYTCRCRPPDVRPRRGRPADLRRRRPPQGHAH